MDKNSMTLWDQVSVTDPATTKRVNQRGGFTAIDAQAQLKKATEVFGPYGFSWGLRDLCFDNVYGSDGTIVEITLLAEFYYPHGDEVGTFPLSNEIKYRPGDECRKKLVTDLRSKCLSTLGFNSDVFEGKFDDNRYVENLNGTKGLVEKFNRALAAMRQADSMEQIQKIQSHYKGMAFSVDQMIDLDQSFQAAQERIGEREAIQQE